MARLPKNKEAPGIYRRGDAFWLRFTLDGIQQRVSLHTDDYATAVIKAKETRKNPSSIASKPTASTWDKAISGYIKKKIALGKFTPNTAVTARYAIQAFKDFTGLPSPQDIAPEILQNFYNAQRKIKAEATARGDAMRAHAFLNFYKISAEYPTFRGIVNVRDEVVPLSKIRELIQACPRNDLQFILLAGFCAGMRKDEIIMARPSWFDFEHNRIKIPARDGDWTPKSKRGRSIPLTADFQAFFDNYKKAFPDWNEADFILHPKAEGQRYRWDFRRPFNEYMKSKGMTKVTPHTMRHSFITHLATNNVSLAVISAISGDRIKTLETNYLHVNPKNEVLTDVFDERTDLDKIKEMFEDLKKKLR
jgi:integrase